MYYSYALNVRLQSGSVRVNPTSTSKAFLI